MTIKYIISQLFVVIGMSFVGTSYLCKSKKVIMILCVLSSMFYGLQYLLLGALTGVMTNIVSIIRNIWFYVNAKANRKNSIFVLISICLITIVLGVSSYENVFSIIPIIATLLFTYSVWQNNIKVYRWLSIPISISWITYNTYYKSIFGIICELILFTFEIVGIFKLKKIEKN